VAHRGYSGPDPDRDADLATMRRTLAAFKINCMADGGGTMKASDTQGSALFAPDVNAAVVRYQVRDLERAIAFYAKQLGQLGFELIQRAGPVATVARGDLRLLLSGQGASGSKPLPDGRQQEPGGWNRIVLYVKDLDATICALSGAGIEFRNEVMVGPGGKQIQIEDPDGNAIELHEAPRT
jgi:glyoxylase I family protein